MTSVADLLILEEKTYERCRAQSFKIINDRPDYWQLEKLEQQAVRLGCEFRVSYEWADDFGLEAAVIGAVKYKKRHPDLAEYVKPTKPPITHADIILAGPNKTTSAGIDVLNRQHEAAQVDYAIFLGFQRGCGENIREALAKQYYEQLAELPTLMYKKILVTQYFEHARKNWVFLDDTMETAAIKDYSRDMEEDQHLTAYINQLNREQVSLKDDANIKIADEDKNRQFMTQVWAKSDLFGSKVMKDWMLKEPEERKWEHSTAYFKKHNTARERFEQARGQERPTDGALAVDDLEERIERKIEARYERLEASQNQAFALLVKTCEGLGQRIDEAPTTRRRAAAQISVADTSDDESDDDSDDESVVVETKRERKSRIDRDRRAAAAKRDVERKKAEKKAAKKKKADKALAVAEEKKSRKKQKKKKSKKAKSFADGDGDYEPGMEMPTKDDYPEGLKDARREFFQARGRYHNSGTKAAKADKIKTIKENLARAEAMEVENE